MGPERTSKRSDESLESRLRGALGELERTDLRRSLERVERRPGGRIVRDGRAVVDFSSNDYLGLASDPRIAEALASAARSGGTGAGAARLISGNHPLHEELEEALARFKGTEAALLFATGFMANAGVLPALAGEGDVLYSDELNHASVVDGCRLSRADVRVFPHRDLDALDGMLDEDAGRDGNRWIVVDGVFSMDGDLFPLDRLAELADAHGAHTYVDDAHGTGVLGDTGRGSPEHWGVEGRIDVVMGTLGKALGTSGAFVAGSFELREWLLNRARSFVFTTGTPPALAAATLEALRIIEAEPERRERLRANGSRLRHGLRELIPRGKSGPPAEWRDPSDGDEGTAGHITPLVLGEADRAVQVGRRLLERGFQVGTIRPPSVPEGTSRLRISVSAAHEADQIDALLEALDDVLRDVSRNRVVQPPAGRQLDADADRREVPA